MAATEHAPRRQRPPQISRIVGRYTVIPSLEKLVSQHGGHNAAARALHVPQATLSRWRRSEEPHARRLQVLLRMLEHSSPLHLVDGRAHDALRERVGITTSEYATLLGKTATAVRDESTSTTDESLRHARRQTLKLRPAILVEGTELTAIRTSSSIRFADAALALGIPKTTLFRMEKALVSQHLVTLSATRLPLLRRLLDEPSEHVRLCNVVGSLGISVHAAQRALGFSRKAWHQLDDAACKLAIGRLLEAHHLDDLDYDAAVTIVDGELFKKHRIARMRSIAEAAALHTVATTRLQMIERTHGHLAFYKRLLS